MLAIVHVCALAAWELAVDPSGRITSLSDGTHELVEPSVNNGPVLYYGPTLYRLGTPAHAPLEHGKSAAGEHVFTYGVSLGDGTRLHLTYRVALASYPTDGRAPEVTFLNQTVSTRLDPSSPPPNGTLGILMPRAATLRGVAAARGTPRTAAGYHRAAIEWTTSDFGPDASWCYVAAGVQWDPPDTT